VQSNYDAIVVGAGFAGLAAGIRLADFGQSVLVLETHAVPGGLNSYYFRRPKATLFNTGLHAFTNRTATDPRWGLGFVCRNLGLVAADFELHAPTLPTRVSSPRFDLSFREGSDGYYAAMHQAFGTPKDRWEAFLARVKLRPAEEPAGLAPADNVLSEYFAGRDERDAVKIPVSLYGGYCEGEIAFRIFAMIFRSLFIDGFGSPPNMKHVLDMLVGRLRQAGGEIHFRQRVAKIVVQQGRAQGVILPDGRCVGAEVIISTAGLAETDLLLGSPRPPAVAAPPVISAVEVTLEFPQPLASAGVTHTLAFLSDHPVFDWRMPDHPAHFNHYTVSAADAFADATAQLPHHLRIGGYQKGRLWQEITDGVVYRETKLAAQESLLTKLRTVFPRLDTARAIRMETMTPRTVARYTAHADGGIYGSPVKAWDGKTSVANVFLAGNDRGGIGIVGAMVSGVLAVNLDVILKPRNRDSHEPG
jgi:phytoene dehydrogenase-like protein